MSAFVDQVLPNGSRLLVLRHGLTPLVEARLQIPAPCHGRDELAEAMLVAACLEHRLADGPVELSIAADVQQTAVSASCAVSDAGLLMKLLGEIVLGDAGEVESARGPLVAKLRMTAAHPDAVARLALAEHLYGAHPLAIRPPGEAELTRIGSPPRRPFDPRGAILILLTPDDPGPLADAAVELLANWRPVRPASPLPALPAFAPGRLALLPLAGAAQSLIRLRAEAVTVEHEQYPALFLAAHVLGGSLSSRLARSLREDKGYVYGIITYFDLQPGLGMLAIEADTAAATTAATLGALAVELRRMRTHPPTLEEIESARAQALGSMVTRLAPRAAFASALADLAARSADPLALAGFAARLREVRPDDVVAAGEFVAADRFSGLVAAEPGAVVEPITLTAG